MKKKHSALVGILMAATVITPVLAADPAACLQHNRMKGWQALSKDTMVFTDINFKRYTVKVMPACPGLDQGGAHLIFHTWENLACLQPGQIISVVAPGTGRTTCAIASVTAGAPAPAQG